MRDRLTGTLNLLSPMRRVRRICLPFALLLAVMTLPIGSAYAAIHGAIYTTDKTGTVVNQNIYPTGTDVYLSGGPQNMNAAGLTDGTYYFQVTDPSGKVLLSTDNASCRQLVVTGGRVTGASPAAGACAHADGTFNPANGATPVQLAPFTQTPNAGDEFKAWLIAQTSSTSISTTDPTIIIFEKSDSKTDNFKTQVAVPVGSCQPSSSLSVLVSGANVTSYVPKGNWSAKSAVTGVSVVNVEGSSIVPTLIPTANAVNSCASNSATGTTVCTANNTDVYLLSGTTLGSTLTSGGSGVILFSGGVCTNCSVAMDAVHNKAVLGLSIAAAAGFQFLDLGTSTFETAVASPAGAISEDPLIDPIHNFLLSPSELNDYEIASVAATPPSLTPLTSFFENPGIPAGGSGGELDSAGEDCSTEIALAPVEFSGPSNVFIADLTQATFTAGAPGTWMDPVGSQVQTLSESFLTFGASGIAVAQGTHTGILSGEFSGNAITAIALPTTSGIGTPAISDWVTCNIPTDPSGAVWNTGDDPHTLTAYQSPSSIDAIGLLANGGVGTPVTFLARVDLTQMLNPTIVPRTVGGHGCSAGTLPPAVVSFVAVP
jgi:hypothetical protein